MKVLIVEDDKNLSITTKAALEKEFVVYTALDGKSAKRLVYEHKPEVILLDIMLPDISGYDLIPYFKKDYEPIVIIISALEEEKTRLTAYKKGADDYMIKPITLFEIRYKLKALKSRYINKDDTVIHIGDIVFNTKNNELSCQHNRILCTPGQATIFKLLYEKYKDGQVLSKTEILEYEGANKTMSVRVHTAISRIRKNLESIGCEKIFIENIYGEGYQLVVIK
ncbi:response regulator transcription factor [Petroclostridium sp. X23]|uniref:response regulator transcription factor n=1 Tax=Petroclostridium sp. X23 TaxID=3045146 RepID=UPI0024ADBD84|nr:response regulator transcription factor [Petroclostridium sp. X23]WHH60960.1 response regulator transcription factor [Petroclostridium sp. X23]